MVFTESLKLAICSIAKVIYVLYRKHRKIWRKTQKDMKEKNSPNSSKFSTQIESLCIIWHVALFFLLNASTGVLSTDVY